LKQNLYVRNYLLIPIAEFFCIPDHLIDKIISEYHFGTENLHLSTRTLKILQEKFWWLSIVKEVKKVIDKCNICRLVKKPTTKYNLGMVQKEVRKPFELVGLDLDGPIDNKSKYGNKYLLVMVDYYSNWVESFPIRMKKKSIMFKKKWIYRFGNNYR